MYACKRGVISWGWDYIILIQELDVPQISVLTNFTVIPEEVEFFIQPSHSSASNGDCPLQGIGDWLVGSKLIGNCRQQAMLGHHWFLREPRGREERVRGREGKRKEREGRENREGGERKGREGRGTGRERGERGMKGEIAIPLKYYITMKSWLQRNIVYS